MNRAPLVLVRRLAVTLAAGMTLAATAGVASAQAPAPAGTPPAGAPAIPPGDGMSPQAPNPAADAAYQEARRLYDLREWDAAIAKFKEAYRLRPDAPSLFNIAQANRLKGDCAEALSFYKTYRRNFPNEKNVDKVDRFIGEMETCVQQNPQAAKPDAGAGGAGEPPAGTGSSVNPPPGGETKPVVVVQEPSDPGATKRMVGLGLGGAGVALLAVSLVFEIRAHSAASDAEGGKLGQEWDPGIQSRGESSARNAKITLAAGGALLVTGGVLYMLGRRDTAEAEAAHVAVVPHGDGASLVWGSSF